MAFKLLFQGRFTTNEEYINYFINCTTGNFFLVVVSRLFYFICLVFSQFFSTFYFLSSFTLIMEPFYRNFFLVFFFLIYSGHPLSVINSDLMINAGPRRTDSFSILQIQMGSLHFLSLIWRMSTCVICFFLLGRNKAIAFFFLLSFILQLVCTSYWAWILLGVTIRFNQWAICSFGVIFEVSMFGKFSPILDVFFSHNTTSLNCGTIGQLNGTTRSELQWKIFGLDGKFCHQIFHYLWCEIDDVSIFISTIDSTFEKFIGHLIK